MCYHLKKFRLSTLQRSICMPFPSSFRCRESGQTSESIGGTALIPNPQAILVASRILKTKTLPFKHLMCKDVICLYSQVYSMHRRYLSSYRRLVAVEAALVRRIIQLSCRIHTWMNFDRFPLRSVQIKCCKEKSSFCSNIKPEQSGLICTESFKTPISAFPGPTRSSTVPHASKCFIFRMNAVQQCVL